MVPWEILDRYVKFVAKNRNVSIEYFLMSYYNTTDFSIDEDSADGIYSFDIKSIKELKNSLIRDGLLVIEDDTPPIDDEAVEVETPAIEVEVTSEQVPVGRRPLAEMDDAEIEAYYRVAPWNRHKFHK